MSAQSQPQTLKLRVLSSTAELRDCADAWNRLWLASDCTVPSARAEIVALWLDSFAPTATFCALVIEEQGKFVAALPLQKKRFLKFFCAGHLPCNVWAASGDLLVDEQCDKEVVLSALAEGISQLPWRLIVLERIAYHEPRWSAFRAALKSAGLTSSSLLQHKVAQVEIGDDWSVYEASLNRRHRKKYRKNARLLESSGRVELRTHSTPSPEDVESLMVRGFEVEDRSWKGKAGTSAIRNKHIFSYYVAEARKLAEWNELELAFLEQAGESLSFCYLWNAKGVRYCVKIGYDEKFARFGPGHQMRMRMLQHAHEDRDCHLYDFRGPVVEWHKHWATGTYDVGRIIVTPRRGFARLIAMVYVRLQPALKRARTFVRSRLRGGAA